VIKYAGLLCSSLLALSSCKAVEVDSTGAISSKYISQVDALAGSYEGTLRLVSSPSGGSIPLEAVTLELTRDGNRPLLLSDIDLLGDGCNSQIGKLLSLDVGGVWNAVASFDFDPGRCGDRADGRRAVLYLRSKGDALFTIFKDVSHSRRPSRPDTRREYRANLKRL
jgi:hypothetical protein